MPKGKLVIPWRPVATVRKYDENGNFIEEVTCEGNRLTNSGMNRLLAMLTDDSVEPLSAEATRIGVGNNDESASGSDTALSTGSDQWYQVLDDGYPIVNVNSVEYKITIGVDEANFTWACWGIDVDDAWDESPGLESNDTPADLFNRKVFNFGTKSGGIWNITIVTNFEG